ncbi:hypothetical protein [Bacillus testis]|uniref:hypothetical protein n=1 Tax=Bacillus testis TaxID=1622072 RepID=UPI00067ED0D9|nr:hypothetical protein [Bacillus testis]
MMRLLKWLGTALLVFGAYKYRYKLMNRLLGFQPIRSYIVAKSMKMPYASQYMMQRLFRP